MPYTQDDVGSRNPIYGGMASEHAAGALVIGALLVLWLIGRGFRGIAAGGVSVGVR